MKRLDTKYSELVAGRMPAVFAALFLAMILTLCACVSSDGSTGPDVAELVSQGPATSLDAVGPDSKRARVQDHPPQPSRATTSACESPPPGTAVADQEDVWSIGKMDESPPPLDGVTVLRYASSEGAIREIVELWFRQDRGAVRPGQRISGTQWMLVSVTEGGDGGYSVYMLHVARGWAVRKYVLVQADRAGR